MSAFFAGKKILVTGGTGSIGSTIVRQLLKLKPAAVRLFSRDEHKQFELQQSLNNAPTLRYLLGDVRDLPRLERAMEGIDYVFHAAAYKHVPFCEYNSFEAVKTNVLGTQNVVDAALRQGVSRVLLVSTDKAASPNSVMGATKLLAEKMMTSAMESKGSHKTIFGTVRFGNVLGSRGSVIPLLCNQIRSGGPVTVTDPLMTRFFMSVEQAVELTFRAMQQMKFGELFVLKMPVVRLGDLVDVLIEEVAPITGKTAASIKRKTIGIRPGEKMHELLMTGEEAQYAMETEDMFIVHSPLSSEGESRKTAQRKPYSSEFVSLLKKAKIKEMLKESLDFASL
jgi:FlaA1/EpsC-like NDP-sugar epimerase